MANVSDTTGSFKSPWLVVGMDIQKHNIFVLGLHEYRKECEQHVGRDYPPAIEAFRVDEDLVESMTDWFISLGIEHDFALGAVHLVGVSIAEKIASINAESN